MFHSLAMTPALCLHFYEGTALPPRVMAHYMHLRTLSVHKLLSSACLFRHLEHPAAKLCTKTMPWFTMTHTRHDTMRQHQENKTHPCSNQDLAHAWHTQTNQPNAPSERATRNLYMGTSGSHGCGYRPPALSMPALPLMGEDPEGSLPRV